MGNYYEGANDYVRGLNDAWNCAKKISTMSSKECIKVFGYTYGWRSLNPLEAISKVEAYNSQKNDNKIKVGTVLSHGTEKIVVTSIEKVFDTLYWDAIRLNDCNLGNKGEGLRGKMDFSGFEVTGEFIPQIAELFGGE